MLNINVIRMKKLIVMFSMFAFIILASSPTFLGIVCTFFICSVLTIIINKPYGNQNINMQTLIFELLTTVFFLLLFVTRWYQSNIVHSITDRMHVNTTLFLILIGILLSIFSLPFLTIFLNFVVKNDIFTNSRRYKDEKISLKKEWQYIIIIITISIAFELICSATTSIFHDLPFTGDSVIFQTIGKYWPQGKLPYRDLWDSKGPIIFFIDALGYALTGNRFGILIIQIINICITILISYVFLRQGFKPTVATLITIVMIFVLMIDYDGGNNVEELALPYLILSFYMVYKYICKYEEGIVTHNPKSAYVYGLTVAICLLTRATNMLGVAGAIAVMIVLIIRNNEWRNLFENILWGCGGLITVILPFAIYFSAHGALYDMLYGSILYNLSYASNSGFSFLNMESDQITYLLWGYSNCIILLGLSVYSIIKTNNKSRYTIWFAASFFTALWLFKSNGYRHYGIVSIPMLLIWIIELKHIADQKRCAVNKAYISSVVFTLCLPQIFVGVGFFSGQLSTCGNYLDVSNNILRADEEIAVRMIEDIPEFDRNRFIAYNVFSGIYLDTDICPVYPYFVLQEWEVQSGSSLKPLLMNKYESCVAKWILVQKEDDKSYLIDNLLSQKYRLYNSEEVPNTNTKFYLYCLR